MRTLGSEIGKFGLEGWLRPADAGHDGCWRPALGNPAPIEVVESLGAHRMLLRSGYCCGFHRTWTNYPHHHAYYEICLVLGGSGEFLQGGERHRLVAGDVFVADPQVKHEIQSRKTRDLSLVFFTFRISKAAGRGHAEDDLLGAFLAGHKHHVPAQFQLFHYLPLLDQPQGARSRLYHARRVFVDLVVEMIAALTPAWQAPAAQARPSSALDLALDYLQRHVTSRVDVKTMAAYACTSERTLRRLFRQRLGRSIQDEIQNCKVHFAATELAAGRSPGEIAERLGMESQASFTRLFKRQMGLTPVEYRRNHASGHILVMAENDKVLAGTDLDPVASRA